MTTSTDVRGVREAVGAVPDPELPPVTIGMLGMIHDIALTDEGQVVVELLPTYSGCPATQMIERDVAAAAHALPGVREVTVRFRFDPPWHPGRISELGRRRLREFGIAPPVGEVPTAEAVSPAGRPTLPVAPSRTGGGLAGHAPTSVTGATSAADAARPCPYCGSTDTTRDSAYGPTPCRDLRFCAACQQPFEAFRSA